MKVGDPHRAIAKRLGSAQKSSIILGAIAAAHPNASVLRALAGRIAEATGASLGALHDGANATGAWLAGAVPHRGPAGAHAAVEGRTVSQLIEGGAKGWISLGVEPEWDCYDSAAALSAFSNAEFCVSLTSYDSAQVRDYANVMLPIAPFAENEGTLVNHEGKWQSFNTAVPALGDSRPAWKVLRVLANLLACNGFDYIESTEVRDEVRPLCDENLPSMGASNTLDALPAISPDGLNRVGDVPIYAVDALVRRASALQTTSHAAEAAIAINAALAGRLGLVDGDQAKARQNTSDVVLGVRIDERIPDDCVRVPAGLSGSIGLGASFGPIEIEKA